MAPVQSPDDPLLIKARTDIEAKIPPEMKAGYTSIVTAGLALLFSDQTHDELRKVLAMIQQQGNQPEMIANGMVKALMMIAQESQDKIQPEAMFPALVTLTTYVLDYMKRTQGLQVTPELMKSILIALQKVFMNAVQPGQGGASAGGSSASAQPSPPGVLAQPQGA